MNSPEMSPPSDPSDSCYKNRGRKIDALLEIGEAFGRGWNVGECSSLVV